MSTNKQKKQTVIMDDLIFVGFAKQVIALDRYSGEKVWEWKSPDGAGCPAILVDGDRLVVSVHGYTYCLEPTTGSLVWKNELKGHGMGIPTLASVRGTSPNHVAAQVAAAAASTASATGVHTAHGIGR